ncbi:MFS general substrate transporter [Coprinopsis marcescibilis]|uniref:MFS general substrate transporter n=1 Tax=Coprinopsis marcescibilis TaxID=230819 RepID=A0A5C3KXP3_COPMA|nr:MFS general substrate transporter [Coprinopsis marcescibilis]
MNKVNQAEDTNSSLISCVLESPTLEALPGMQPRGQNIPANANESHGHAEATSAPASVVPIAQNSMPSPVFDSSQGQAMEISEQPKEEVKPRPTCDFTIKEQRRLVFSMTLVIFFASALTALMMTRHFDEATVRKDRRYNLVSDLVFFGPLGGLFSFACKNDGSRINKLNVRSPLVYMMIASFFMASINSADSWVFRWACGVQQIHGATLIYLAVTFVAKARPSANHGLEIGIFYAAMRLGQAISARFSIPLVHAIGSWRKVQYIVVVLALLLAIFVSRFIPNTRYLEDKRDEVLWQVPSDPEKEAFLEKDAHLAGDEVADPEKQMRQRNSVASAVAEEVSEEEDAVVRVGYSEFLRKPQIPRIRLASAALIPAFISYWVYEYGFKSKDAVHYIPKGHTANNLLPFFGEFSTTFALGNVVGSILAGYACDHLKSRRQTSYYPELVLKIAYPGLGIAVPVSMALAAFAPYLADITPGAYQTILQSKYLISLCAFWGGVGSFSAIVPLIVYLVDIVPHTDDLHKILVANTWFQFVLPSIPFFILAVAVRLYTGAPLKRGSENLLVYSITFIVVLCFIGFGFLRRVVLKAGRQSAIGLQ